MEVQAQKSSPKPKVKFKFWVIPALLGIGVLFIAYAIMPPRFEGKTLNGWIETIRSGPFPSNSISNRVEHLARVLEADKKKAVPELLDLYLETLQQPKVHFKKTKEAIHQWIPFLFQPIQQTYPSKKWVLEVVLKEMNLSYNDLYPRIQPLLESKDSIEHYKGLSLLVYIDDRVDLVVKELDRALNGPSATYVNAALFLAGQLGTNAAPLAPSIIPFVDPDNMNTPRTRMALQTLAQIRGPSAQVFPELLTIYLKTDEISKTRILNIFAEAGTDFPGLKDILETTINTSTNGIAVVLAAKTLLKINPEHQKAQETFLNLLLFEKERKKLNLEVPSITRHLADLGPDAEFAASALAVLIQK